MGEFFRCPTHLTKGGTAGAEHGSQSRDLDDIDSDFDRAAHGLRPGLGGGKEVCHSPLRVSVLLGIGEGGDHH